MAFELMTERLRLRFPERNDAETLARQIGDRQVARMLSRVPYPYNEDDARDWLSRQAKARRSGTDLALAIERKDEPGLIGVVGLSERTTEKAEIGYWLGRDHWGRGYMSEAAGAMVTLSFEVLALSSLGSGHFEENPASARVLTKLGFKESGREKMFSVARGEDMPTVKVRLDAERWAEMSEAV